MATSIIDKTDVEKAIVSLLKQNFYVNATVVPGSLTPATINGQQVMMEIFRGYAATNMLQSNVAAPPTGQGGVYIAVNSPDICRSMNPGQDDLLQVSQVANSVAMTVSGSTVTITGQGALGLNTGIAWGGLAATYRTGASDTPEIIAEAFASIIPGSVANGPTITLATTQPITMRWRAM